MRNKCFRPLAGMNCFDKFSKRDSHFKSFRPLAGMNCFVKEGCWSVLVLFPSPCGDELFRQGTLPMRVMDIVSVPLRG